MIDPITELEITDPSGKPVRDPSDLEHDAEFIRSRLAPMPVKGQIKTPDEVIEDLEFAKYASSQSAVIIRDADKTWRAVNRLTLLAHGKAMKLSDGKSAELREADAYEQTEGLHALQDAAEVALNFAKSVARSVESSTSALQTQAGMVKVTFGLAGTGREQ